MAVFQVNFLSQSLNRTVIMNVILPTDKVYFPWMEKREEDKPYKTLYLLHGVMGNCTDWLYGSNIQKLADEHDLAVVMPSGENSAYIDQPWNYNFYGKYIGEEIVEFTRKTFPLSRKKEDTYIGGLSIGGYGALHNGIRKSDTFGAIIAFSSAFFVTEELLEEVKNPMFFIENPAYKHCILGPDFEETLQSESNIEVLVDQTIKEEKKLPAIFMACGKQDSLLKGNHRFSKFLTDRGIEHVYIEDEGSHEWNFWGKYLQKGIEWLPLEEKSQGASSGNVGGV